MNEETEIDDQLLDEQPLEKDKKRAERRKKDVAKALRKRRIAKRLYTCVDNVTGEETFELYRNLHQYSKNKIHCSCPMCAYAGPSHGEMMRMRAMAEKEKEYTQRIA